VKKFPGLLVALVASIALALGSAPVASAETPRLMSGAGLEGSPARGILDRLINPDEHVCGPTDLDVFIAGLRSDLTEADLAFLDQSPALDIPTVDALLFGTAADPDYAVRADYRRLLTTTFRDAQRFWDIDSGDIQLMSMHGSMMQDQDRVARVLQLPLPEFGMTPAEAATEAQAIADAVSTGFDGGNNPLFTLNAFAFSAEGDPDQNHATAREQGHRGDQEDPDAARADGHCSPAGGQDI